MHQMKCLPVLILFVLVPGNLLAGETPGSVQRIPPQKEGLLATEKIPGKEVFVHDAIRGAKPRVTVWFDEQFLGEGTCF